MSDKQGWKERLRGDVRLTLPEKPDTTTAQTYLSHSSRTTARFVRRLKNAVMLALTASL